MDLRTLVLLLVVSPCHAAEAPAATVQREPWQTPYAGSDAGGQHVLGLWSFDGPDGAADSSSHHHKADLEGAEIVPAGRFGSALQSAPGWPVEDKSHRLLVKNHPALSPQGPFTLELWIKADDRLKGYPESFLIDKKYVGTPTTS